jgi:hypothetical protein
MPPGTIEPVSIPWPLPLPPSIQTTFKWKSPPHSLHAPLPLRITAAPMTLGARAACIKSTAMTKKDVAAAVMSEYLIGAEDMMMVYISPDPF